MFRRLVVNIAISAVAFFFISAVGILLTPILVHGYGMAAFGLIGLARLFLPTGMLALIDFGVSEVAIQATARAREDGAWRRCASHLTLLTAGSLVMGVMAAILLSTTAFGLADVLNAPPALYHGFAQALLATALCLPLLFLSLGAEGVIKGFERYGWIRTLEVGSNLLYAALALTAVYRNLPFQAVCYAYLIAQSARALVAISLAILTLRYQKLAPVRWSREDRCEVIARCRQIAYGRLLGSLQSQSPPLLIAILWGAAAAGVYDVLSRLPRFAKSVLGLINSTLLPVAVRLDASANHEGVRRLGETGLLIISLATFPAITASIFFSREILALWIGPQLAADWGWQSLMFLTPALMSIVGFGSNALLGRLNLTRRLNRVTTVQVILQLILSLSLTHLLQEKSFILGQVLSLCITFPWSMRIIIAAQGLTYRIFLWLAQTAGVAAALAASFGLAGGRPESVIQLGLFGAAWMVAATAILWWLLPTSEERSALTRIAMVLSPLKNRQKIA